MTARVLPWILFGTFGLACAQTTPATPDSHSKTEATHAPAPVLPNPDATTPANLPGLHNVVAYGPDAMSGSQPEGKEGFESLAALGIRTVISVDGARPDVEAARAAGLRYVHLPISYDDVPPERQKQLAQALASLPGPFYLHCHHGKHRSAAALGSAVVWTGALTAEQATARMKVSGTSKDYTGLYAAVGTARRCEDVAALKADPAGFPEVSTVSGLVATMSEVDQVFDHLKQAKGASWAPPASHPDLVPEREARRLADLFAALENDQDVAKKPAEFRQLLARSRASAQALADGMGTAAGTSQDQHFAALDQSCKSCHTTYRDRR